MKTIFSSEFIRRFKRNQMGVFGLALLMFIITSIIVGPFLSISDPTKMDMSKGIQGPSWDHPFGTDVFGRDILTRILYGGRISLSLGVVTVLIASCVGVPIGLLAGYFGGRFDTISMRIIDGLLAFPEFLLAIIIVSGLGPGIYNAMIAIGIYNIPIFARLARSSAVSLRSAEFIIAAKSLGARDAYIIRKHIFPNCLAQVVVLATIRYASTILVAASLGFLGLGAQPPSPEWGSLMAAGRSYFRSSPHIIIFPGIAVALSVLSLNLLGDSLNEALDPRNR
jgi:peptide/nickel transport system permease protein